MFQCICASYSIKLSVRQKTSNNKYNNNKNHHTKKYKTFTTQYFIRKQISTWLQVTMMRRSVHDTWTSHWTDTVETLTHKHTYNHHRYPSIRRPASLWVTLETVAYDMSVFWSPSSARVRPPPFPQPRETVTDACAPSVPGRFCCRCGPVALSPRGTRSPGPSRDGCVCVCPSGAAGTHSWASFGWWASLPRAPSCPSPRSTAR